jgi:hypothetical protein
LTVGRQPLGACIGAYRQSFAQADERRLWHILMQPVKQVRTHVLRDVPRPVPLLPHTPEVLHTPQQPLGRAIALRHQFDGRVRGFVIEAQRGGAGKQSQPSLPVVAEEFYVFLCCRTRHLC